MDDLEKSYKIKRNNEIENLLKYLNEMLKSDPYRMQLYLKVIDPAQKGRIDILVLSDDLDINKPKKPIVILSSSYLTLLLDILEIQM